MALRIKYFIRVSKGADIAPIRVRFSNGREFDIYAKTGEQIKPVLWNNKTGAPRKVAELSDADRKEILNRLDQIERHIITEYDKESNKSSSKISSEWLGIVIDKFHNPGNYVMLPISCTKGVVC